MTFRLTLAAATGTLDEYMEKQHGRIARAATTTMDMVRDKAIADGRANILSGGFSSNMANGLRGVRFPRRGYSIDAAVWIWHRVPYAGLFEDGGEIVGNPMLWLPLRGTMPKLGRRKISPSLLESKGVELVSISTRGNMPLLGAAVRLRPSQYSNPKPTLAQLRKGRDAKGKGKIYTIPLFHGIRTANISKKIDVKGVAARTSTLIPTLLVQNLAKES